MNDIQKEFVPYTEALELKQLGFDEPCFGWYDSKYQEILNYNHTHNSCGWLNGNHCTAPTFSQAFRFFREKYGLRNRNYGSLNYSGTISEYFEIFQYAKGTSDKVLSIIVGSLTYEEAELACLRKMIEIVKQKQQ